MMEIDDISVLGIEENSFKFLDISFTTSTDYQSEHLNNKLRHEANNDNYCEQSNTNPAYNLNDDDLPKSLKASKLKLFDQEKPLVCTKCEMILVPDSLDYHFRRFHDKEVNSKERSTNILSGVKDKKELFLCIKLCNLIKNPLVCIKKKLKEIWLAYFYCIPDIDFQNPLSKWKIASLNGDIATIIPTTSTMIAAIETVFDLSKLPSNQWKRPYLLAYNELICSLNRSEKNTVAKLLMWVAINILGIELISYHGGVDKFFNKGRTYVRIVNPKYVEPSNQEIIAPFERLDSFSPGCVALIEEQSKAKVVIKRNGGRRSPQFSQQEIIDAVRGYNTFGPKWQCIYNDPRLIFCQTKQRTPESIKNHVVNLLIKCEKEESFYFITGFKDECRPLGNDDSISNFSEKPTVLTDQISLEKNQDDGTENNTGLSQPELRHLVGSFYPDCKDVMINVINNIPREYSHLTWSAILRKVPSRFRNARTWKELGQELKIRRFISINFFSKVKLL